jgi:hypothetical protein
MCYNHDSVINSSELDPTSNEMILRYAIYYFVFIFIRKYASVDDQYLTETLSDFIKLKQSVAYD